MKIFRLIFWWVREKLVLKHSDFAKGVQKASQAHSSESSFIGSGGEILFIFNNKSYGISCINFLFYFLFLLRSSTDGSSDIIRQHPRVVAE